MQLNTRSHNNVKPAGESYIMEEEEVCYIDETELIAQKEDDHK